MLTFRRTNSEDFDFKKQIVQLDAELADIDGNEHDFYAQYNTTDNINHVIVAFDSLEAVACGALKMFDVNTMELKRMYTIETYRGKGIASAVVSQLELWAREMGFGKCILETGVRQPDAIRLYLKTDIL